MVIRILREYERGVIFRLGRFHEVRGPGLFVVIPVIESMMKIDLRVLTLDVPSQDVITKDNVAVKVDAVLYFKVSNPESAICELENYILGTSQLAQTSLRRVVGEATLDEVLSEQDKINTKLHKIIDTATDPWGIKVDIVELKHVVIPEAMQRAIAKQAEAERARRAKVILAEGELQAAGKLKEAGEILGAEPIVLRYLETLGESAKEPNTTVLFPIEMLDAAKKLLKGK